MSQARIQCTTDAQTESQATARICHITRYAPHSAEATGGEGPVSFIRVHTNRTEQNIDPCCPPHHRTEHTGSIHTQVATLDGGARDDQRRMMASAMATSTTNVKPSAEAFSRTIPPCKCGQVKSSQVRSSQVNSRQLMSIQKSKISQSNVKGIQSFKHGLVV